MERRLTELCRRASDARWFSAVVLAAIVANAALLAVESYAEAVAHHGQSLRAANVAITALFVVEIAVRLLAHGRHPGRFFRDGWNIFDVTIVVAILVPFIGGNPAILRLVRLLRMGRLFELVPDLRIIIRGLLRSVAPMCSVAALTLLVMYVYAIAGWLAFGDGVPQEWGDAGTAMMTMFQLLTLDDWGNIFARARDESLLAVPFFISFVLVGGFVVLNIVIAVVINSVEEARRAELETVRQTVADDGLPTADNADMAALLRAAADELERRRPGRPLPTAGRPTDDWRYGQTECPTVRSNDRATSRPAP